MRGCASRFHRCRLTAKTAQTPGSPAPSQAFCPHARKVERGHHSQTWSIPSGSPPACFSALTSNTTSLNSFQFYMSPGSLVKISNLLDKPQCSLLIFPHLLAHQSQCSSVLSLSGECLCTPVALCLSLSNLCLCRLLWFLATVSAPCPLPKPLTASPSLFVLPKLLTFHLAITGCVARPLHSCSLKDCLQIVYLLCFHTTVAVTTASV